MSNLLLLALYGLFIAGASYAGGRLPQLIRLTHRRMQIVLSAVGGLMLGVAVLHLLPHAQALLTSLDVTARWLLAGVLLMFFLLRAFHFHHHPSDDELPRPTEHAHGEHETCQHGHHHDAHEHGHHAQVHGHHRPLPAGTWSWAGVFLGLSLHTLIDGMALAASVYAEAVEERMGLWGAGVFAAVLLHKPLDAMAITSLMTAAGWSQAARNFTNLAFALMCPLGAAAFVLGVHQFAAAESAVVGRALALSAGVFLCISLSDLLPEIEFHSHDRLGLSATLLGGVLAAYAIGFLEPAQAHTGHSHAPSDSADSRGP